MKWSAWEPTAHLKFEDGALIQLWRRRRNKQMIDGLMPEIEQQVQWRPVPGQPGVTNQSKVFGEKG